MPIHPDRLLAHLRALPDPRRVEGRRYPHAALLGLLVLGMLHGKTSLRGCYHHSMRRLQQPRSLLLLSVLASVTVACGPQSATPTLTPADLVTQALADTNSLTSYHFVRTLEADEQSMAAALLAGIKTEGDFVAPDKLYLRNENFSMLSDAPRQELHTGGVRYIRRSGDTWVLAWPEHTPESGPDLNTSTDADFVTRQIDLLLSNSSSYADKGLVSLAITATGSTTATTPTVVSTRHITYTIDAAKWASSRPPT